MEPDKASDKSLSAYLKALLARTGISNLWALIPLVIGLAMSRASLVVANYGSYAHTSEGVFTDTSTLIAAIAGLIFVFVLFVSKYKLSDAQTTAGIIVCTILQLLTILVMFIFDFAGGTDDQLFHLVCSSIQAFASYTAMAFWLRQVTWSNSAIAVVLVFSALVLSEPLIYLCAQLDQYGLLVVGFGVLLQFPMIYLLKRPSFSAELDKIRCLNGFTLERRALSDRRLVITIFLGLSLISMVLGILRGYPNGMPVDFTPATRIVYMILTILVGLLFIYLALRLRFWALIVTMWVTLQVLIGMALILTFTVTSDLSVGAIFTTVANGFLSTFIWYLEILLMSSFDKRDPYVYSLAMAAVWVGFRALSRIFYFNGPLSPDATVVIVFTAVVVIVSAQAFFVRFFVSVMPELSTPFIKHMTKLDEQDRIVKADENSSSSRPRLPIRRGVRDIGARFMLSEREVEVLTLYALGYTQKRTAEELFISPATVHAHIKRIYLKTNLHSRQEVLDYIEKYTPRMPDDEADND